MQIPNTEYDIDLHTESIFLDGIKQYPINGYYEIYINDKLTLKRTFQWLFRLTIFNTTLPKGYNWAIEFIEFPDYSSFGVSKDYNFLPIFNKPILFEEEYRLIARYPNYAVNSLGEVKNVFSGLTLNIIDTKVFKYKRVRIHDKAMGRKRIPAVHRLVAMTYCPNDDYVINNVVDHKDRNKQNNISTNLRWTCNALNIHREVITNDGYLVRNIDNGKITYHNTILEVSIFIGRSSKIDVSRRPLSYGSLWRGTMGIFEIQLKNKNNTWVYENKSVVKIMYRIQTPEGDMYFNNLQGINNFLGLDYSTSYNVMLVTVNKKYGVNCLTTYQGYTVTRIREAKNIHTGEVITSSKLKDFLKRTGLPKSTVIKYLDLNWFNKSIHGWLIRYQTTLPWADTIGNVIEYVPKNMKVLFTSITGEIIEFESIKSTSNKTKMSQRTIVKKIKNNSIVKYNNFFGYLTSPL